MKVKSIRLPDDIDRAIGYVSQNEKLEKTQSFGKLARIGFEAYVGRSYEKGKLTLRQASELLSLTLSETIDLLQEMGVRGNIRTQDVMESLEAIRS